MFLFFKDVNGVEVGTIHEKITLIHKSRTYLVVLDKGDEFTVSQECYDGMAKLLETL